MNGFKKKDGLKEKKTKLTLITSIKNIPNSISKKMFSGMLDQTRPLHAKKEFIDLSSKTPSMFPLPIENLFN